jgi:hypothetical protein
MPFCTKCGSEIPPGKKFCGQCGTPSATASSGAKCPACHTEISNNERFCKSCGFLLKPEPVATGNTIPPVIPASARAKTISQPSKYPPEHQPLGIPPPLPVQKRRKKGGCLLKSLIIVILLIITCAIILYFNSDLLKGPGRNSAGELSGTDIPGIVSIDDTMAAEAAIAETEVNTGDPTSAAEKVEDAFTRADTALLKQMLTPASLEIYKGVYKEIKPYMSEYSKAFSNRKLKMSTSIYSLYEFTDETGKKYTAEFALSDDGQWKLVRF